MYRGFRYYLELAKSINPPPILVVWPSVVKSSWQSALLNAISNPYRATLLQLQTPVEFRTLYVPGMLSHIGLFGHHRRLEYGIVSIATRLVITTLRRKPSPHGTCTRCEREGNPREGRGCSRKQTAPLLPHG